MLSMESLWCSSESELSSLKIAKTAERPEYRFSRRRSSKSLIPQALLHCPEPQPRAHRRRRSGTWPRTRSLNAPSPIQQFGPCGRIMKNSAMVMQIQDPASQRLTWYKPPLTVLVIKKVHDASILASFVQLVHWLVHDKSMVVFVEAAVLDDTLLAEYGDFASVRERLNDIPRWH
uniref:Poly(P)/ATP NAD kinase n=1 Tax=Papilio xuthus TaxID=66420 RepID=I4DNJ0_PAPXU|nr:poly(p)/ATP NAD kinase [Papilio xuthus]